MAGKGAARKSPDRDPNTISFDMFGQKFSFTPIRLSKSAKTANSSQLTAAGEYDHLQKQIGAFEKLTQHAISKFSSDKLHSHLTQLIQLTKRNISIVSDLYDAGGVLVLNSISKVRLIVSRLKKSVRQSAAEKDGADNDAHALSQLVHYFEAFFQDVQYVRELKKYFSEKVHLALYENFYDPTDVDMTDELERNAEEQAGKKNEKSNAKSSGRQEKSSRLQVGLDLDNLNEKERLSYAVEAMFKLHCTWERLCIEGPLSEDDFEADSRIEMREKFGNRGLFELVLRLLPDMFVKSFKCSELAKIWLQNARSVYVESVLTVREDEQEVAKKHESRIVAFTAQLSNLQNSHRQKQLRLAQAQEELLAAQAELTKLESREERLDGMKAQLDAHEQAIQEAQKSVESLLEQRSQLLQALEAHRASRSVSRSESRNEHRSESSNEQQANNVNDDRLYEVRIAKRLKDVELQMIKAEQKAKTCEYARDLLHSDFALALEIRPNYVASRATADSRCMLLKNEADLLIRDKLVLERKLTLVRTNLDKMKEIVTRFARPGSTEHRDGKKSSVS